MSVMEALERYSNETGKPHVRSKLISAISRWVAPSWGHPYPKNTARLSSDEKRHLLNFLDTVQSSKIKEILNIFNSNIKAEEKSNIYTYRSEVKKFYEWSYKKKYFFKTKEITKKIAPKHISKFSAYKGIRNKKNQKPYALMARHPHGNKSLIYPSDYINNDLKKDISKFQKFELRNKVREVTTRMKVVDIKRFLGWLHRYKNIPLEDLRLTSIIFEYSLTSTIEKEKTIEKLYQRKFILKQEAIEKAKNNIALIQEYFDFLDESQVSDRTKKMFIVTFTSLSKFVFEKELGEDDEFIEYEDLPIIKRLRRLTKTLDKSQEPQIPHSDTAISWEDALEVLETLRIQCIAEYNYCGNKTTKRTSYNHLQRFISLALCMIIPTDRARTYYELEVGKTFKFGYFLNGRFKNLDWNEKDEKGNWFINLKSDDYKTGKTYGEYWSLPIDNLEFKDGTKFYDYIYKWLKEGRNYGKESLHNYFFTGTTNHQKLTSCDWNGRIRRIFLKYTGVPVTPTSLRRMSVTQERRIGATAEELKASALARHHSLEMAENVYNQQTQQELIAPYQRLTKKMLGGIVK